MERKIIYERGEDMYIYSTAMGFVRIINSETGEAEDTTNPHIIRKVVSKGEEVTNVNYTGVEDIK